MVIGRAGKLLRLVRVMRILRVFKVTTVECLSSVCEADLEALRSFVIMLKVETKTRMTLMTG